MDFLIYWRFQLGAESLVDRKVVMYEETVVVVEKFLFLSVLN